MAGGEGTVGNNWLLQVIFDSAPPDPRPFSLYSFTLARYADVRDRGTSSTMIAMVLLFNAGTFDSSRNDLGITEKSAIHFSNTSDSWTFFLGHGIDAYVPRLCKAMRMYSHESCLTYCGRLATDVINIVFNLTTLNTGTLIFPYN